MRKTLSFSLSLSLALSGFGPVMRAASAAVAVSAAAPTAPVPVPCPAAAILGANLYLPVTPGLQGVAPKLWTQAVPALRPVPADSAAPAAVTAAGPVKGLDAVPAPATPVPQDGVPALDAPLKGFLEQGKAVAAPVAAISRMDVSDAYASGQAIEDFMLGDVQAAGLGDPGHGVAALSAHHWKAEPRVPRTQPMAHPPAPLWTGSGVVIHSELAGDPGTGTDRYLNIVMTAAHVVKQQKWIAVSLDVDGQTRTFKAKVVSHWSNGPGMDLGLVSFWSDRRLPSRPVAGQDGILREGDRVIWVGKSPAERGITPHAATVTGMTHYRGGLAINTDRSPSPGHSGGPLLDMLGRVVGITTARDAEGIFASLQSIHRFLTGVHWGRLIGAAQGTADLLRDGWDGLESARRVEPQPGS
ncbi:MAG: serine protease [Elusimicrobiota bacterium]